MEVAIRRVGFALHIRPSCKAILESYLSYDRRVQTSGNSRDATYVRKNLWRQLDNDTLITYAGFTERVIGVLKSFNISVKYEDYNKPRLDEPDYTKLDSLRELQPEVIAQIVANDHGVIEAPTGVGKGWLICQMCKMWPKARILIACAMAPIVRQTYEELKPMLYPGEVGLVGAGCCERDARVVCCIDKSLLKCDLEKFDILFYDEVHRGAAPRTAESLIKIQYARRYGFSASPKGRGDNADLETEALFGPVICKLSYQEVQRTGSLVPIEARIYSTALCQPLNLATTVALNRHGLWRNECRNKLIASAVYDIQKELGADCQILISVTTVDHAVHLGALLRDFTLVYVGMKAEKRLRWEKAGLLGKGIHPISAGQREEYRKAFHDGTLKRVIATGTWGTGVNFPGLEVLIRADGAGGAISNTQIPGRVTRVASGKDLGVVIDFDDVFNKTLEGRANKRMAAYKKKGWGIVRLGPNADYLRM